MKKNAFYINVLWQPVTLPLINPPLLYYVNLRFKRAKVYHIDISELIEIKIYTTDLLIY